MSRVSDLTCTETMSAIDETEKKERSRIFQPPVGLPVARIAPVMPSVVPQQNSRQFVKTCIRGQTAVQIPTGYTTGTQKVIHPLGTATVSPTPQCTAVPPRSKLVSIRSTAAPYPFFKSYDIAQVSGNPMTTVYLQQPQNLHPTANPYQPVVSLPSSRARDCEEPRVVRSSPATFANCGSRYLTSIRSPVGDVTVRTPLRVNPVSVVPMTIPSRNGCKFPAKDLRGAKAVTRIPEEKTDGKSFVAPLPAISVTCTSASPIDAWPGTCLPMAVGQHDNVHSISHLGPSARPSILRKTRENGPGSTVRRIVAAETYPHSGLCREVLGPPAPATKDDTSAMCLKRAVGTESRMVAVPASVEISPRKRLRKQNFNSAIPETAKLLLNNDRITGDSFVNVKDELTWKTAELNEGSRSEDDNVVPEKMPRRRSRVCTDNGTIEMFVQQHISSPVTHQTSTDSHTKTKNAKKVRHAVSRSKLMAPEVSNAVKLDSRSLTTNEFVEDQTSSQFKQSEFANAELARTQEVEDWDADFVRRVKEVTALLCHVFGIDDTPMPDDPKRGSKEVLVDRSLCELPTFSSVDNEVVGNGISGNRKKSALKTVVCDKKAEVQMMGGRSSNTTCKPGFQQSSRRGFKSSQIAEQIRKISAQMIRFFGLKDRWQRYGRLLSCERLLKRIYLKRLMLQQHFRTTAGQLATLDVELNLNLIAALANYSPMAGRKQAENFFENYPVCSPSTSDNIFEKSVNSGPTCLNKYVKEALECDIRNACGRLAGRNLMSCERRTQTGSRTLPDVHYGSYVTRRDAETEMLQAVAEVLAELLEVVIKSEKEWKVEKMGKPQLGRIKKKRRKEWIEVDIANRFGSFVLPQPLHPKLYNSVLLYDKISQHTLKKNRKSVPVDSDDAFFMNLEKELHRKKRVKGNRNLSRTLHSLKRMRAVYQELSDVLKVEHHNLGEATKLILDNVKCTDTKSYFELINEHNEDCQLYDSEGVREEKWQKRLLSFTKAIPQNIPDSDNYDPNKSMKFHPSMNLIIKLFHGKYRRPLRRLRSGVKRARKSQSRRGRGRQRGSVPRPKKKSPTPEPRLEDLEPHFTAAEMSAIFKKKFESGVAADEYDRSSRKERNLVLTGQEHSSEKMNNCVEKVPLLPIALTIQNRSCAREVVQWDGNSVKTVDTVNQGVEAFSKEAEVAAGSEDAKSRENHQGHRGDESHGGSSETVPYINSNSIGETDLMNHIQIRGRYIREHFATLLHALRINELLVVKAIKMVKDYTVDLFDRKSRNTSVT